MDVRAKFQLFICKNKTITIFLVYFKKLSKNSSGKSLYGEGTLIINKPSSIAVPSSGFIRPNVKFLQFLLGVVLLTSHIYNRKIES